MGYVKRLSDYALRGGSGGFTQTPSPGGRTVRSGLVSGPTSVQRDQMIQQARSNVAAKAKQRLNEEIAKRQQEAAAQSKAVESAANSLKSLMEGYKEDPELAKNDPAVRAAQQHLLSTIGSMYTGGARKVTENAPINMEVEAKAPLGGMDKFTWDPNRGLIPKAAPAKPQVRQQGPKPKGGEKRGYLRNGEKVDVIGRQGNKIIVRRYTMGGPVYEPMDPNDVKPESSSKKSEPEFIPF